MPFGSVSSLKESQTFQRSKTLRMMPEFRLRRFVEIFDSIHAAKKAAGAPDEEAEATAFAMAYAAARRFQPPPAGAKLEGQRHYFATMKPIQFSQGGEVEVQSFDYVKANFDAINAAVAGNTFNLDHKPTEPIGAIHRLLLVDDQAIPQEVRAKLHADTPFVVEASYFEGTPDDIKAATAVSAEWLPAKPEHGVSQVILPYSFAVVSEDPATDQDLGVGRIAGSRQGAPEKPYESNPGLGQTGSSRMTGSNDTRDSAGEAGWQQKAEAALAELESVKAKLAGLTGTKDPQAAEALDLVKKAEARISAAEESAKKASAIAQELKDADRQRKAEDFARATFEAKEVASVDQAGLVEMHLEDPVRTEKFAAMLPKRAIPIGPGKAASALRIATGNAEEEKAHKAMLADVFAGKERA